MEREMRLTKDLREQLVDSVMAGTKRKAEEAEAACIAACNKELSSYIPRETRPLAVTTHAQLITDLMNAGRDLETLAT